MIKVTYKAYKRVIGVAVLLLVLIPLASQPSPGPRAKLVATPTSGFAPLLVTFDGSGSTKSRPECLLKFFWDFGDGTKQKGPPIIQHIYRSPGRFLTTLTVIEVCEHEQQQAEASVAINVLEPRTPPPRLTEPPTLSCVAPGGVGLLPGENFKREWQDKEFVDVGGIKAKVIGVSRAKNVLAFIVPLKASGRVPVSITPAGEPASNVAFMEVARTCAASGPEITKIEEQLGFALNKVILSTRGMSAAEREALKKEFPIESLQTISIGDIEAFTIASLKSTGILEKDIKQTVETAEALAKRLPFADLNWLQDTLQADPKLSTQDHIFKLNIPLGWQHFFPSKGAGILLAVIDSGIETLLLPGEPLEEINSDPGLPKGLSIAPGAEEELVKGRIPAASDEFGHGTIVSTIAAAKADNGIGGVGVAPNAITIHIKVFSLKGKTTEGHVGIAMIIATKLGADVVNMSIGCFGCFRAVKRRQEKFYDLVLDAIEEAFFREKIFKIPVFVAASGNDGLNFVDAPARNSRVIAVGSYNFVTQQRSDFSNYGPEVDFVAPGDNVNTMKIGGEWGGSGEGTSFSAPQVAGLVALILSMQPELGRLGTQGVIEKIKTCFVQDIPPAGFDEETGWGLMKIPDPKEVDPKKCLIFR